MKKKSTKKSTKEIPVKKKFHKHKMYKAKEEWTVSRAQIEIDEGINLLNRVDSPLIGFVGSSRTPPDEKMYKNAKKLAYGLGMRGYAIIAGNGKGIMEAANSGAIEAKTISISLKADLLKNREPQLKTKTLKFHYFFSQRFIMLAKTKALVFYPGGLGTLNELLEDAMLMQNQIISKIPLICVGKEYWKGLFDWMKKEPVKRRYVENIDFEPIKMFDKIKDVVNFIEGL
ncbi:MAG: LOG family protein [Candidatus Aenigmatarchaeota archaeon]